MKINYTLKPVVTDKEILRLAELANEIWHEYFPAIISAAQIDYMVERFQSYRAIGEAISEGYEYFLLKKGEASIGYVGIREETELLFLSKLYLKSEYRGKGLGFDMLQTVLETAEKRGKAGVYLTVNRKNEPATGLYRKLGFNVMREQKSDIGGGFFMDDFVMIRRFAAAPLE